MLILKITGLVLLAVLIFIILVLCMILFIPVRYGAHVNANDGELVVKAYAGWLFGVIRFTAEYKNKTFSKTGHIFFVRLFKDKSKTDKEDTDAGNVRKEEYGEETTEKSAGEKKQSDKKIPFLKRIKNLYVKREYVERVIRKEKPTAEKAFRKLKKVIVSILPRRIKGELRFGFDDPAMTGQVLGALSILYARTGMLLKLYPDFENKCLKGDAHLKGRIYIARLAYAFVIVYFNKRLKRAYRAIVRLTEIEWEG